MRHDRDTGSPAPTFLQPQGLDTVKIDHTDTPPRVATKGVETLVPFWRQLCEKGHPDRCHGVTNSP